MPDLKQIEEAVLKEMAEKQGPFVVLVDGSCASGKSTLAFSLQRILGACLVHVDDFYFPRELPRKPAEGNSDLKRIYREVLLPFKTGGSFSYRPFDPKSQRLKDPVFECGTVLILEGTYSMHPSLYSMGDFRIFLDAEKSLRLERLKKRDPEKLNDFIQRWIPAEERYFNKYKPWNKADLFFFENEQSKSLRPDKDLVQYSYTKEDPMSDKSVILGDQAELLELQAQKAEEVIDHLIKVQSIIDVVANSLESKNTDNKLDIASELNSLVAAYDQLECAQSDISEVAAALKETVAEDNKNA